MTTKELRDKVAKLTAQIEKAREAALKDPARESAELLRTGVVNAKLSGGEVARLAAERDAVVAEIMAPVTALTVERTKARRALRDAEALELAATLADKSTDDLTAMRHGLTAKRRALKAELRGVVVALSSRAALDAAKAFLPTLTPEQKAALRDELDKG